MEEQKVFYTKAIDDENSVQISTPIDGYEMNENVSCTKCKSINITIMIIG